MGEDNIAECVWKAISELQLKREETFCDDIKGTQGFRAVGCYECSGYCIECRQYQKSVQPQQEQKKSVSDAYNTHADA